MPVGTSCSSSGMRRPTSASDSRTPLPVMLRQMGKSSLMSAVHARPCLVRSPRDLEVRVAAVALVDDDDLLAASRSRTPDRRTLTRRAALGTCGVEIWYATSAPSVSVRKPCAQPSGTYSAERFSDVKLDADPRPEGGRFGPEVDRDVEDGARRAAHELRPRRAAALLVMEPSQRPAAAVVGDTALGERRAEPVLLKRAARPTCERRSLARPRGAPDRSARRRQPLSV